MKLTPTPIMVPSFLRHFLIIVTTVGIIVVMILADQKCEGTLRDSHSAPLILTDLIEEGKLEEAREKARVRDVLDSKTVSYSGFLRVNSEYGAHLYFWFSPAADHDGQAQTSKSKQMPVMLWAGGSPEQPAILRLFTEIGAFKVQPNMKLKSNHRTIHQLANLIYMDVVVGTGFSFTKDERGYPRDEADVADHVYKALEQFFKLFPQLKSNPFYVFSNCFTSKVGPAIAVKIHRENNYYRRTINLTKDDDVLSLNLKGLAVGDGVLDEFPGQHMAEYLYFIHAVNSTGRSWVHRIEESAREAALEACSHRDKKRTKKRQKKFSILAEKLYREHRRYYVQTWGRVSLFPFLGLRWSNLAPSIRQAKELLEDGHFQKNIHVDRRLMNHKPMDLWRRFQVTLKKSVKPDLEELLGCKDCYRVLIFISKDGHIAPNIISGSFIQNLRWSGQASFRRATKNIWHQNNNKRKDVLGHYVSSGSLTKLVVYKTGHFFPLLDRNIFKEIIDKFLNRKTF